MSSEKINDEKAKGSDNVVELVHTEEILPEGSVDPIYQAKAQVLNDAIQGIGIGRYQVSCLFTKFNKILTSIQWHLFIVTGFGWLTDNLYPVVTGLILPPVLAEFPGIKAPFIKLAQNIGLLIGAFVWGLGSDVWGRRISFNVTLLIVGIFATAAGGAPNYTTLSAFAAVWSIGVGGNLPVDSAIFLEAVPATHQYLLTVLSVWWAFGQLLGALVAWPLIANFSCASPPPAGGCRRADNQGWRYFLFTMGGLMLILWGIRFFVFKLRESPKYLMGRGRDAEAVENVHKIAAYNGKTTTLTVEDLQKAANRAREKAGLAPVQDKPDIDTSAKGALSRSLEKFSLEHVKALFATPKLAWSTTLIIIIWGTPINP